MYVYTYAYAKAKKYTVYYFYNNNIMIYSFKFYDEIKYFIVCSDSICDIYYILTASGARRR